VTLTPDSILTKMTGEAVLAANSSHHQAVDRVAGGLRVTGISPDGVVEVMEGDPHSSLLPWLLAVQFHPERLFDREPGHAALFRGFVDACQAKRGKSL
jgi:putative glutamine amidotransferase